MMKKDNFLVGLTIVVGSIAWGLTMVKSGLTYSYGVGFWGPNGHDGIWHIALIRSLANGSWNMPVFSGEVLKNYHVGFDVIVASLYKLTHISVSFLYFQILPPFFAVLIGLFAYLFVLSWIGSRTKAVWSVFFIYFGGSLGWVVNLLRGEEVGGESMFWSQQSLSTLVNPPFALSLVLMFAGLWQLVEGLKHGKKRHFVFATFLLGVLIQVKVYAGILIVLGLFIGGFWRLLFTRKLDVVKVATGVTILSIILFAPVTSAGSIIVFKPFWFLETMMGLLDRLNWPRFYEAMVNYRLAGNYPKYVLAYLVAFGIFVVGNFGFRLVGLIKVLDVLKSPKTAFLEITLLTIVLAGIVAPMVFLQTGTPWNTIQFLYYSLMLSGIFAGLSVGQIFENVKPIKKSLVVIGAFVVTMPVMYATLKHYLPNRPPAKVSLAEIEALAFLEKQEAGVVLTYPFDRAKAHEAESFPPRPLYLYESTAYVSAYTGKPVYLEDEVNLDITGYNWKARRVGVEDFYTSPSQEMVRHFLVENNIKYIYWLKGQRAYLGDEQLGIRRLFENTEVTIYEVI